MPRCPRPVPSVPCTIAPPPRSPATGWRSTHTAATGAALADYDDRADILVGWLHDGGIEYVHLPARADIALIGCTAPERWRGAAVLTEGTVRDMAPGHPSWPAHRPDPAPLIVAADRTGHGPVAITADHPRGVVVEPGPVPDALLRFLGRPTPVPDEPPSALAHRIWLHRVLTAALLSDAPERLGWPFVGALHPASDPGADPRSVWVAAAELDAAHRWRTIADHLDDADPAPPVGALDWFDQGSHHRWWASRLPESHDMLHDLAHLLDPGLWRAVAAVIGGHGTDPHGPTVGGGV